MTRDPASAAGREDDPDSPVHLATLGQSLLERGQFKEAAEALVRAISQNPELAVPSFHLGLAARELGDMPAAVLSFERASDLEPATFDFEYELARALASNGEDERAVGHYQAALILNPSSASVLMELGVVLGRLGRYRAAVAVTRRAAGLRPDSPQAHAALGVSLRGVGAFDESIAELEKARGLRLEWAAAERELGLARAEVGELSNARSRLRRALELDPSDYRAHGELVELGFLARDVDEVALETEVARFAERHADPFRTPSMAHSIEPEPGRRLRVGYLFGSLGSVEDGPLLVPLFAHHDRRRVELHAYSNVERPDAVTRELRARADRFRDVRRLDDAELSELIRFDGIDVLVDLVGYGSSTRLRVLAQNPAPCRVGWLPLSGVLPRSLFDGEVTDVVYDPLSEAPVSPPPALTRGSVTFGSLGPFREVNDDVILAFARVLGARKDARLILAAPRSVARDRTLVAFERAGIDRERIEFLEPLPRPLRLKWHEQIDVALDTFPSGGLTRTLDAFWLGVPVVTLAGTTPRARRGATIASRLGLAELVAGSLDDYVEIATRLAADPERLAALRVGLRKRVESSPLMAANEHARTIEAAYRELWEAWCKRAAPR